jgi:lipopolysaccharide/colanic/teichoic acid biosynthesis glycosyltransferase
MSEQVNTQPGKIFLAPARSGYQPSLTWVERIQPGQRWIHGRAYERIKRGLDIALLVLMSPLLVPLMGLCWVAIKATSPLAPALFVQLRTGQGGRRFPMYKFRTMVPNAEALKAKLAAMNERQWPDFKVEKDPRVTRLGAFLRKTSLDELPQMFNVLKGDMTLVGPRPTSFGAETYEAWQWERLTVPPGVTGLWQIDGRGHMEFDERVRLDLTYIARRSLSLDFRILVRTVTVVLNKRGAC